MRPGDAELRQAAILFVDLREREQARRRDARPRERQSRATKPIAMVLCYPSNPTAMSWRMTAAAE